MYSAKPGAARCWLLLLVVAFLWALLSADGVYASSGSTERVSVGTTGNEGNGDSHEPAMSASGRYVAFQSYAANLVDGDTGVYRDVFVHDRQTGTTERVSVSTGGDQGKGDSRLAAISAGGRFVAFSSYAPNLVDGDTNRCRDAFVHDRHTDSTERVSVGTTGNQGNGDSLDPAISADGRYVAFYSHASNLVPGDTNSRSDVFVHDRHGGTTERVSVDTSGNQGNGDSYEPAISANGHFVAFQTLASNLVPGDTNSTYDVFVHNRHGGMTERVSVDLAGGDGNGFSQWPTLSADGRYVAFQSLASNLVTGDTNGESDVFVRARDPAETRQEVPEIRQEAPEVGQEAPVVSQEAFEAGQEAPVIGHEVPVAAEDIQATSGTPRWGLHTLAGIGFGLVPLALVVLVVGFLMAFGGRGRAT